MALWSWCWMTIRGPRPQMGVRKGTPFQTSTRASRRPCRLANSSRALPGKTRYLPDLLTTS